MREPEVRSLPLTRERGWWIAGAVVFLLPWLVFLPEVVGWRSFYLYDLQYYFYAYRKVGADVVRGGGWPLWNAWANGGMPLLGDGQVGLLFPGNWWVYVLGAERGMMWGIVSGFSVAGAGMLMLGRALRMPVGVAGVGAGAFMFGGFFVGHMVHPSIAATAGMCPWVFWAGERVRERFSLGRVAAGGAAVAMQVFAGHPQVTAYCGVAMVLYAVVAGGSGAVLRVAGMYGAGIALSGAQLVPWVELMSASPRAGHVTFEMFDSYSMRGGDWWMALFPYLYGGPRTSWMQGAGGTGSAGGVGMGQVIYVWERLAYVGVVGVMFAARGAWGGMVERRDRRVWGMAAVVGLALLLAAGGSTPLGRAFFAVPVIGQMRGQARVLGVAAMAACVLGMFGMRAAWERWGAGRRDWALVACAGAVLAAVVVGAAFAKSTAGRAGQPEVVLSGANVAVPVMLAVAGMVGAWWGSGKSEIRSSKSEGNSNEGKGENTKTELGTRGAGGRWLARRQLGLGVMALAWGADLVGLARTFYPTVEGGAFGRVPGVVTFLKRAMPEGGEGRVAAMYREMDVPLEAAQGALTISWAMAYGIEDANGFNSLQPRRLADLLWGAEWDDVSYGLLSPKYLFEPRRKVLDALDVRYVLLQRVPSGTGAWEWQVPPGWKVAYEDQWVTAIENPTRVRRAFLAEKVEAVGSRPGVLARMRLGEGGAFDATSVALVEDEMTPAEAAQFGGGGGEVERETWGANERTYRVRGAGSGKRMVVVSETFWPGWKVEGRTAGGAWEPLRTWRANYMFWGVEITGDMEVRMRYAPASVAWGGATSGAALVALACAAVVARRNRRGDLVEIIVRS